MSKIKIDNNAFTYAGWRHAWATDRIFWPWP